MPAQHRVRNVRLVWRSRGLDTAHCRPIASQDWSNAYRTSSRARWQGVSTSKGFVPWFASSGNGCCTATAMLPFFTHSGLHHDCNENGLEPASCFLSFAFLPSMLSASLIRTPASLARMSPIDGPVSRKKALSAGIWCLVGFWSAFSSHPWRSARPAPQLFRTRSLRKFRARQFSEMQSTLPGTLCYS